MVLVDTSYLELFRDLCLERWITYRHHRCYGITFEKGSGFMGTDTLGHSYAGTQAAGDTHFRAWEPEFSTCWNTEAASQHRSVTPGKHAAAYPQGATLQSVQWPQISLTSLQPLQHGICRSSNRSLSKNKKENMSLCLELETYERRWKECFLIEWVANSKSRNEV